MLYDITAKDLCKYYPVYTKAGFIWKNRINWEVIQVPGNKVKTYFGIFTFLRAYKVDKVWYWVLTDGTKTITVKRDQARRNKKLPKTATVQTTLMLAQPKELIDQILEQANTCIKLYNSTVTDIDLLEPTWEQTLDECNPVWIQDPVNLFEVKIQVIAGGIACGLQNMPTIYRQLIQYYHPDHNNYPTEYLEQVKTLRYMF